MIDNGNHFHSYNNSVYYNIRNVFDRYQQYLSGTWILSVQASCIYPPCTHEGRPFMTTTAVYIECSYHTVRGLFGTATRARSSTGIPGRECKVGGRAVITGTGGEEGE